jgi:hypothetical protein
VGSGTPLTTYVTTTNGTRVFAEGRGDMGRTPRARQDGLARIARTEYRRQQRACVRN